MNFEPTAHEVNVFAGCTVKGGLFRKRAAAQSAALDDWNEEDHPRDEQGKFTDGSAGAGASAESGTRRYEHIVGGQSIGHVEIVPLTKQLYDKHVAHMTSADPLAVGRQSPEPSTFERTVGKGFTEAVFRVTPNGTRVFWMLGKKGFTPRADGAELRPVK